MYIKVDYSEKRKSPEGYAGMPGEYAIYTKNHWWEKWKEGATFADIKWAISEAKKMREFRLPMRF